MMNKFIDFVHEIFPSISPYTKDEVNKALEKFKSDGKTFKCFLPQEEIFDFLAQGDIYSKLPFIVFDKDGNQYSERYPAIMISNTCHAENQSTISFCPLLPVSKFKLDAKILLGNTKYSMLYFPDPFLKEYVVDFSVINSYNKNLIINALKQNSMQKIGSLSNFGYYLFLTKLTIHFMRPEDVEVNEDRQVM